MTNRALRAISGAVAAMGLLSTAHFSSAGTGTWDGSDFPTGDTYETGNHWQFGNVQRNPSVGDNLIIDGGLSVFQPASIDTNLILSASSSDGQSVTVNNGVLQTLAPPGQTGQSGGCGLLLSASSSLVVTQNGFINLAGEFVVGLNAGDNASATIEPGTGSLGGQLLVGQDLTHNLDPTLYDGFFGNGTITQTGGNVTSSYMAIGGLTSTSQGTYQFQNGFLTVTNETYVGGTSGGSTGAGTVNISGGSFTNGGLKI